MRERITNDSVKYFVNNLVPLSQRLFDRKVKASEGGRAAEAKVWEVVIGQIWDCLPGFLDLARDLREVGCSSKRNSLQKLV
jgi:ribosomal RNA-processing protein 12